MTASTSTLSERLLALKEFLPGRFTGRHDIGTDAAALLDECAAALDRGEADGRRLDKLTLDPSCLRTIGQSVYWNGPQGHRRVSSPRQALDAAIRWDAESATSVAMPRDRTEFEGCHRA